MSSVDLGDALDDPWVRGRLVGELFAVDPVGVGGIQLRSGPTLSRDHILKWIVDLVSPYGSVVRVPVDVSPDRLLGGLSLAASLREGRPVFEDGILARADRGMLVIPMAERAEPSVISHICAALDRGALPAERDGFSKSISCRLGVVALDEGVDEERVAAPLTDRLAFALDLSDADPRSIPPEPANRAQDVERARALVSTVVVDEEIVEVLSHAALALGVSSLRAVVLSIFAARAHAALRGIDRVDTLGAAVAAALVLAPRATCMPSAAERPLAPTQADKSSTDASPKEASEVDTETGSGLPSGEVILDAVLAALPRGLLEKMNVANDPTRTQRREGRSGAKSSSRRGGRPAGHVAGAPEGGARIHLLATLTAAVPWQPLRKLDAGVTHGRVHIRKSDLRVLRLQRKRETLVIFCVDASGSSAAQRLSEAKGAVEQFLAECYARRDHVALVAFRGETALTVLPPTRSLARARKCLAGLPGGGATPIAAGIDAAVALSVKARKSGKTPIMVLMTDGRANVARDGTRGGGGATADALASARVSRAYGLVSLLLDTSPRPRGEASALASAMGATYMHLPYLDSQSISRQVRSLGRVAS